MEYVLDIKAGSVTRQEVFTADRLDELVIVLEKVAQQKRALYSEETYLGQWILKTPLSLLDWTLTWYGETLVNPYTLTPAQLYKAGQDDKENAYAG